MSYKLNFFHSSNKLDQYLKVKVQMYPKVTQNWVTRTYIEI